MNKMLDSVTDGPRHPDEDAEYLEDIARGIHEPMECPNCKEIGLTLKRIDGMVEEWGCVSCGNQVNFGVPMFRRKQ